MPNNFVKFQEFEWHTDNPDFTECFKQTILVWAPCAFLVILSPLDLYQRFNSRYADIPWSIVNISKFVTTFLLIVLTFIDLGMMVSLRNDEGIYIYDSQIVTVSIKAAIFVRASTTATIFMFYLKIFAIFLLRFTWFFFNTFIKSKATRHPDYYFYSGWSW